MAEAQHARVGQAGVHPAGLLDLVAVLRPAGQGPVPPHLPGQLPVRQPLADRGDLLVARLVLLHLGAGFFQAVVDHVRLRQAQQPDADHGRGQHPQHLLVRQVAPEQHDQHRQHHRQRQPAAARLRQHRGQPAQQRAQEQHPTLPMSGHARRANREQGQAHQAQQQRQVAELDRVGVAHGPWQMLERALVQGDAAAADGADGDAPEKRFDPRRVDMHQQQAGQRDHVLGGPVETTPVVSARARIQQPEEGHHQDRQRQPAGALQRPDAPVAERQQHQRTQQQHRRADGVARGQPQRQAGHEKSRSRHQRHRVTLHLHRTTCPVRCARS